MRSVTTLEELNLLERENIPEARRWLFSPRRKWAPTDLLDHLFVREPHRRMFRHVWGWTGKIRDCEPNLGVPPHQVETHLFCLLEDTKAWMAYGSHPPDEICIRLHHGLVAIHPWRNGNGRHARLIADRLALALERPAFTWGGDPDLTARTDTRANYLSSLKSADKGDFQPLLAFARA